MPEKKQAKETQEEKDTPVFLYFLRFPNTRKVFYIGIAEDVQKRFYQHMRKDGTNPEKDACIAGIEEQGFLPLVQVKHKLPSKKAAEVAEAQYIEYYRAAGHPLTNQSLNYLSSEARSGRELYDYEEYAIQLHKNKIRLALAWLKVLFLWNKDTRQEYIWQLQEYAVIASHED